MNCSTERFFLIPDWLMSRKDIGHCEKLLYSVLTREASNTGFATRTIGWYSDFMNLTDRRIQQCLSCLEASRLIRRLDQIAGGIRPIAIVDPTPEDR